MNLKHIWLSFVLLSVLTGCGRPTEPSTIVEEKKPFYISAVATKDIQTSYQIEKKGTLVWSSEITVSAQIGWRVKAINKQLGTTTTTEEVVIQLEDTLWTYSFGAQRAATALTQAKLNYEQTIINLEKAIQDTTIWLQQATNQAENTSLSSDVSAAKLQLESAKQSYEKTKLDYENKRIADDQTLRNFVLSTENTLRDVLVLYQNVTSTVDQIVGVSDNRKFANDGYEQLLWAKNTMTRYTAEDLLRRRLQDINSLLTLSIDGGPESMWTKLDLLLTYTRELWTMLDAVDMMLQFSSTNDTYTETSLSIDAATIDGMQAQVQGQISAITALNNTINSFLATYLDTQASLAKAVDLAEKSYRTAQANLQTTESNAILQVSSLENSLTTTEKTKTTTEKSLRNAITQAQIAASEASFQLQKLWVRAPLAWTIKDIFVDKGQEVVMGTPLFSLSVWWSERQIEIILTKDEASVLQPWWIVTIRYEWTFTTGIVAEVWSSPSVWLSYKATISTTDTTIPVGSIVTVVIPIENSQPVIPINRVRLVNTTQWIVTIWDGTALQEEIVTLGKAKNAQIEIVSPLPQDVYIVTSDTSQYDEQKYTLQVKDR